MAQTWYYTKDGKTKLGPVSEAELKQLARTGQLQPSEMVRREDVAKWAPASNVQRLFHDAKPLNTADCPKCETAVPVKPPHRSTQQLWQEFVPWYKERFKWAMDLGGVKSILAQAALWYVPGEGFIWIPIWFLWTTRPLYTSAPAKCPKCSQEFEALSEGKNPRFVPFDWANLAATVAAVAVGIYLAFLAVLAIIVVGIGAAAVIFGAAAAATEPSSGSPREPARPEPGSKPARIPQTRQGAGATAPPPQRWAVGVKGAVVCDYDPVSGHGHYHKKCDICGYADGSKTGFVLTSGNTDGSFFCPKCKTVRDVVVEIGRA